MSDDNPFYVIVTILCGLAILAARSPLHHRQMSALQFEINLL